MSDRSGLIVGLSVVALLLFVLGVTAVFSGGGAEVAAPSTSPTFERITTPPSPIEAGPPSPPPEVPNEEVENPAGAPEQAPQQVGEPVQAPASPQQVAGAEQPSTQQEDTNQSDTTEEDPDLAITGFAWVTSLAGLVPLGLGAALVASLRRRH